MEDDDSDGTYVDTAYSDDEDQEYEDDDSDSDLDYVDEQSTLYEDFELGEEIKNSLVPYAVHWYTGEALLFEDDEGENEDESDMEEDKVE